MSWTQPICRQCYARLEPGREPVRLRPGIAGKQYCCICGEITRDGIWYRIDPRSVPYPAEEEALEQ